MNHNTLRRHPPASRRFTARPAPRRRPSSLVAASVIGFATVASLALSGCGLAAQASAGTVELCPDQVVVSAGTPLLVATATSAEPAPAWTERLAAALARAADTDHPVCAAIVTPQGRLVALPLTPRRGNGEVEHGSQRATLIARNVAAVHAELAGLTATDPGLDLRRQLDRAVRLDPAARQLWVISSGVSTAPPIDLGHLGWDLDPATTAQWLAANGWLPDLHGRQVTFIGLGQAAGTQPALSPPLRSRVLALWQGVCRAAGATSCDIDPQQPQPTAPRATNPVPVIALPSQPVIPVTPRQTAGEPGRPARASTTVPAAALFPIDSAVLTTEADTTLRGLVPAAKEPDCALTVIGHTDAVTGTPAHNLALSQARAAAVAARLVALGVPRARITTVTGVGAAGNSAAAERADPALVSRHRTVTLTFSCHS